LLSAPASNIELVYETSKRLEMQEGIFSSILSKEDTCFNDIYNVKLPKNLCPFGCKTTKCPYEWDAEKCPHNLSEKSTEELAEYAMKSYYYGDDNAGVEYEKQVDPKLLKAIRQYKTPGNYGASRQNNNKV